MQGIQLVYVLLGPIQKVDYLVPERGSQRLSLEPEYDAARALLEDLASRVEVTVVPGNHDIYLPITFRERRFPAHFAGFLQSDLPQFACDLPAGRFPCVKLRGPVAIIALSSAVPRPPFVSAGHLGREQLVALARLLEHPEVQRRTPVVLVHHPPVDTRPRLLRLRDGLIDAAALRDVLHGLAGGLVLYGHTHMRVHCHLTTARGTLEVVSASGAALDHRADDVRAGYNRYQIEDDGRIATVGSWVIDPGGASGRQLPVPQREACL